MDFVFILRGGGIDPSDPNLSERGAITFGDVSGQSFSGCHFEPESSVKILSFIVELRPSLSAVPMFY